MYITMQITTRVVMAEIYIYIFIFLRQFTDFTVNFDQLNASLMKKSINLLVLIKIINMNLNSLSFFKWTLCT